MEMTARHSMWVVYTGRTGTLGSTALAMDKKRIGTLSAKEPTRKSFTPTQVTFFPSSLIPEAAILARE